MLPALTPLRADVVCLIKVAGDGVVVLHGLRVCVRVEVQRVGLRDADELVLQPQLGVAALCADVLNEGGETLIQPELRPPGCGHLSAGDTDERAR